MRLTRRIGSAAALSALLATLAIAPSAGAATFTVNTKLDTDDNACTAATDGCSLRDAVSEANASAGSDEIVLPAGRYKFATQSLGMNISDTNGVTTLTGAGARTTIVDANDMDAAFHVNDNVSFNASGVTITGGTSGAISVSNGASVALTDSALSRNQSDGIGGGAVLVDGGDLTLTRTEVDHNTSFQDGGAIENLNGFVHIVDSWIHANLSHGDGGAIDNFVGDPCSKSCPSLGPSGQAGRLTIEGSTLSDNVSERRGGAINARGTIPKQETTLLSVTQVPIGPSAVEIKNSTISGNTSDSGGGGEGGGLAATDSNVTLTSSTVYGNHAPNEDGHGEGGGLWVGGSSTLSIVNTLLAENLAGGRVENCFDPEAEITSLGHNLDSGDTCSLGTAELKNTDPNVGPLSDNGGLTPTHQLLDGSPAIDAADNNAGPETDQRGGHRPPGGGSAGDTRDIGAYEAYSLADLTVEVKFDAPDPATVGKPLTYALLVRNNGPDRIKGVTLTDAIPSGTTLVSASPSAGSCSGAVSCALGSIDPGAVVRVEVVVTPGAAGSRTNTATVSAVGYTETNPANDSASATTTFVDAAALPPANTPPGEKPSDKTIVLNFKAPEQVTLDEFMNGFVVEADCGDELCLRRFREHAAINTGATHIAGFNLTVSRSSLGFKTKTRIRLKPCVSGSSNGRAHRRCVRNLRKAATNALPFRVKVVCSAIDKADNRIAKKLFVKVVDN
jgi:uncharacterized repeat protein (TIGR01451 family)/CSLREA domain-containing protein